MKYSYANNPMMFRMDLARTLDQYERENQEKMKRHRPLKIMTYKALSSVPERKLSWWWVVDHSGNSGGSGIVSFCSISGWNCSFDQLADMSGDVENTEFDRDEYERNRNIDRVMRSLLGQLTMHYEQYSLIRKHMEYIYDISALRSEVETIKKQQNVSKRKHS